MKDKKQLLEKEIEDQFIFPAFKKSGWTDKQIVRQNRFTIGRIIVKRAKENLWYRGEAKIPDFVLYYKKHLPLAIIETKDNSHNIDFGLQQALDYANTEKGGLDALFIYSTNGDGFIEFDKSTGIKRQISLEEFPTPYKLWERYLKAKNLSNEQGKLIETPFYDNKTPYYYQYIAVNRTFEAVLKNQKRILLVMATGTGKTFMASQIFYRLREAKLAKRFLFLVDRNTLADQTMQNDFKIFSKVMTKIKNRKIEKEYEIYLSLYQAVSGTEEINNIYKQFSPGFFDVVVVDECHRGSAAEDAAWREIIEYFSSAVQIGLTATPKETKDISNIDYFGEPVYTYSLYQGIDDGFLAPYKIIRKNLNVDEDGYQPDENKRDINSGEIIPQRLYNTLDFDRNLIIDERTQLVAHEISDYLKGTNIYQKTIIFCKDIDHAQRMKIALISENLEEYEKNNKYIMQITSGEEGEAGKEELENFQNKEKQYPVLVTTSKLLTTGVDAPTVKIIVLDSVINSKIEFKQIIGRGTRIAEKFGKVFFTIIDFRGATEKFKDVYFDGEPIQDEDFGKETENTKNPNPKEYKTSDDYKTGKSQEETFKYHINEVDVYIKNQIVSYYDGEGKLMTDNLIDYTKKNIKKEFAELKDFLVKWNSTDRKEAVLKELQLKGILIENIKDENKGKFDNLDEFDLIISLAYGAKPLTRVERAKMVKKKDVYNKYKDKAQQVLDALIEKYANEGITAIEDTQDLKAKPFSDIAMPVEIVKLFGGKDEYYKMLTELKNEIYNFVA